MSIFQVLWKAVLFFYLVTTTETAPCKERLITPRGLVEKVADSGWLLVRENHSQEMIRKRLSVPRQRRSLGAPGSRHHCGWTYEKDEDLNRQPRFLAKAVCENCPPSCKAIEFHHRVLVRHCQTLRTHRKVLHAWKWGTKTLPVAFVYDP